MILIPNWSIKYIFRHLFRIYIYKSETMSLFLSVSFDFDLDFAQCPKLQYTDNSIASVFLNPNKSFLEGYVYISPLTKHCELIIWNIHDSRVAFETQNTRLVQMQCASTVNATRVNEVKLNERKSDCDGNIGESERWSVIEKDRSLECGTIITKLNNFIRYCEKNSGEFDRCETKGALLIEVSARSNPPAKINCLNKSLRGISISGSRLLPTAVL